MTRNALIGILFGIVIILLIPRTYGKLDAASSINSAAGMELAVGDDDPTPTETPLPTATETPLPTATETPLPTATETPLPTATETPLPTATEIPLPTETETPLPTETETPLPTETETPLPTETETPLPTETETPLPTKTPIVIQTSTPAPPTKTPKPSPTPTNSPPRIDLNGSGSGTGFEANFLVGGAAVPIVSNNLTVVEDSGTLYSATISITNLKNGAGEKLAVDLLNTNIRIERNDGGILKLRGRDSAFNYQKVLRTTTYRNTVDRPNTTNRQISFIINDGSRNSNSATAQVRIVDPKIQIKKEPNLQTIAKGGTAEFRIEVENTGNTTLRDIIVNDPLVPGCRTQITSLTVGAKRQITCRKSSVNDEFTNIATVNARDDFGHRISDTDSARVEIENPNIRVVKSPSSQTLLKGETAKFEIFVINTSKTVNLRDVEVKDPSVPSCNRSFTKLDKQEVQRYRCEKSGVSTSFINEITVTGYNLFNGDLATDSSIATVEVLDMQVELVAEPPLLASPGGAVEFTVKIVNKGSVPLKLQSLESDQLGSLTDPIGSKLRNNSCIDALLVELDSGDSYACAFTTDLEAETGIYDYMLAVSAKDAHNNRISSNSKTNVIVADSTKLEVSLKAIPASLPAPGGIIEESVVVRNLSSEMSVELNALHHSEFGNLDDIGDCLLPQTVGPEGIFGCSFDVMVSGEIGDFRSHVVSAAGVTEDGLIVGNVDQAPISHFDPAKQETWLPFVAMSEKHPEEDNDGPCAAFPLSNGKTYQFAIDDQYDWYYFDVPRSGWVNIQIYNLSEDAQVAIFTNANCNLVSEDDLVFYNGDDKPNKTMVFYAEAGRHFVFVAELATRSIEIPYTVSVQIP